MFRLPKVVKTLKWSRPRSFLTANIILDESLDSSISFNDDENVEGFNDRLDVSFAISEIGTDIDASFEEITDTFISDSGLSDASFQNRNIDVTNVDESIRMECQEEISIPINSSGSNKRKIDESQNKDYPVVDVALTRSPLFRIGKPIIDNVIATLKGVHILGRKNLCTWGQTRMKQVACHVIDRIQTAFGIEEVKSSSLDTKIVDKVVCYMSALSNKSGTNFSDSEHARRTILVGLIPTDESVRSISDRLGIRRDLVAEMSLKRGRFDISISKPLTLNLNMDDDESLALMNRNFGADLNWHEVGMQNLFLGMLKAYSCQKMF